ncbi:hypothetical protein PFHG_05247 [Plasmodium falciparum HB3]|uniref:Uncharacterized protein n=1 Tax=Plasmodium falciparum (isolate HB3) TaxID=137071 RepID=A0A0L7KLG6_PLAFX|nr:hypothetical protein PFHG_05247 [Plasmodium falciparum HB3]
MEHFVAPRVNKKYLNKFYNKNVRLVGKVNEDDTLSNIVYVQNGGNSMSKNKKI